MEKVEDCKTVRTYTAYACATDVECELGRAAGGTTLYSTASELLATRDCARHCGVVEVKVFINKYVMERKDLG